MMEKAIATTWDRGKATVRLQKRDGAREDFSMFEFDYSVSLHISHPDLHPDRITEELRLRPTTVHVAGSPRKTPSGAMIGGIYKESYWYGDLPKAESIDLSSFLAETAKRLHPQQSFFTRLRSTGGAAELWVCWHHTGNSADRLRWELLRDLGVLRIDLRIDVYDVRGDRREQGPNPNQELR